ncbi:hypothetical protein FN846DRAFT_908405 [Sphaerosporella brunnea]|uniref:Uncharacterized protein n=1 Tax=Sphaerosporella brunnea TaxID=1250544 RepID=A0A5J5EST6_9PEZI|nr:hypothetical protein FN846DRAFT_908405 [Sphaerosporella brunnea]
MYTITIILNNIIITVIIINMPYRVPPPYFLWLPNELHLEIKDMLSLASILELILALAVRPQPRVLALYLDGLQTRSVEQILKQAIENQMPLAEFAVLLSAIGPKARPHDFWHPFTACIAADDASRLGMILDYGCGPSMSQALPMACLHHSPRVLTVLLNRTPLEVLIQLTEGGQERDGGKGGKERQEGEGGETASLLWVCLRGLRAGEFRPVDRQESLHCLELVLSRCEAALASVVPCALSGLPLDNANIPIFHRLRRVPILNSVLANTGQPLSRWESFPEDEPRKVLDDVSFTIEARAVISETEMGFSDAARIGFLLARLPGAGLFGDEGGLWNRYLSDIDQLPDDPPTELPPAAVLPSLYPPEQSGASLPHKERVLSRLMPILHMSHGRWKTHMRDLHGRVISLLLAGGDPSMVFRAESRRSYLDASSFSKLTTPTALAVEYGFADLFPPESCHQEWSLAEIRDGVIPMPPVLATAVTRDVSMLLRTYTQNDIRIIVDNLGNLFLVDVAHGFIADALLWVLSQVLAHETRCTELEQNLFLPIGKETYTIMERIEMEGAGIRQPRRLFGEGRLRRSSSGWSQALKALLEEVTQGGNRGSSGW